MLKGSPSKGTGQKTFRKPHNIKPRLLRPPTLSGGVADENTERVEHITEHLPAPNLRPV